MDEVIRLLEICSGAIILGYPQIFLNDGTIKGEVAADQVLPTEWNHIEAGLAYANGLPLLIIHHTGISRGVFDHGVLNSYIHEQDLTKAEWPLNQEITGALTSWKGKLGHPEHQSNYEKHTVRRRASESTRKLSIPRDISSAARIRYDDYRTVTPDDLSGEWFSYCDAETGFPVLAQGSFTGRLENEYATFLVGTTEYKYKIVVFTENESGEPVFIELEEGQGIPRNRYVRALESGSHSISRVVWKHGGPRTLHLERDAVQVGTFESASCAYYWDEAAEKFQQQWITD